MPTILKIPCSIGVLSVTEKFLIMVKGYKIVLTASRSEMSQYGPEIGLSADEFEAFICTFPHIFVSPYLKKYLTPINNMDGSSKFAPYSLRKVEAVLADHFGPNKVIVCHPDNLKKFIGDLTEIVGVSTMDPLGLAYVSTTYNSLVGVGGESANSYEFKRMMKKIIALKKHYKFKVVVGGDATWQIELTGLQTSLGIDHLVFGRSEAELSTTFEKIMASVDEKIIRFKSVDYRTTKIPTIRAPAIFGEVEITRGCGRGCAFCSPNLTRKDSVPLKEVMKEVEINIDDGSDTIFTITEDMFLYKSKRMFHPNREEIVKLYQSIAEYRGVKQIHLSHATLAPVLVDKKLLPELAPILLSKSYRVLNGKKFSTVEIGIESGSVRIMKQYMRRKAWPLKIDNWQQIVCEGIAAFNENSIYPLCTIIIGWPGETEEDSVQTAKLVEELHDQGAVIFFTPIIFIPIEKTPLGKSKRLSLSDLTETQLNIIERCWEFNVEIWGSEVPNYVLKLTGVGAKCIGIWRNLKRSDTAVISNKFANFLLKRKTHCNPNLCK